MRPERACSAVLLATVVAVQGSGAAAREEPVRPSKGIDLDVVVARGLALVRLDPKPGAPTSACDDLAPADLEAVVGGRLARVTSVERVPRPERHWLLIDNSQSAEGRREEAKRSAIQYVREVMVPGVDSAALVSVDEDAVLVTGPTTDTDLLVRAIEKVPPGGASALRDGLDSVLRQIEGDRHEHLVLFWTDGFDNNSVLREDDLLRTVQRIPQATIFPLALLPAGSTETVPRLAAFRQAASERAPILGDLVFDAAERSGGEVFASSDPNWLDRVRGWIGRRFAVTFALPDDPQHPRASGRGLTFITPSKRCAVTILPDPFARPDAVAGEAPPAPAAWVRSHDRRKGAGDDPPCNPAAGGATWDGPLDDLGTSLGGCVLDMVEPNGPIVLRQTPVALEMSDARFKARRIRIATPPLDRLPDSPVDALERLVPGANDDPSAPSALEVAGATFLTQRARLAASLFARRRDYRNFALARLARVAHDDIAAIARDFARAFPDLPAGQVADIARASRAGQRSLSAATTPTDADLAGVLAAWLGDVPASALFSRWEIRLCDTRIRRGADGTAFIRWAALRARLGYPSGDRIVTPLVLIRDRESDRIGFVRIVLPRPENFTAPRPSSAEAAEAYDDRVVPVPLGLWLVDRIASIPDAGEPLRAHGYRTVSIRYERTDDAKERSADLGAARNRVVVQLSGGPDRSLSLDADIATLPDGSIALVRLEPSVTGDPELAAFFDGLRDEPEGPAVNRPATPPRSSPPS